MRLENVFWLKKIMCISPKPHSYSSLFLLLFIEKFIQKSKSFLPLFTCLHFYINICLIISKEIFVWLYQKNFTLSISKLSNGLGKCWIIFHLKAFLKLGHKVNPNAHQIYEVGGNDKDHTACCEHAAQNRHNRFIEGWLTIKINTRNGRTWIINLQALK